MEAYRGLLDRREAERRTGAEEALSRERSDLRSITAAFETERAELLRRVAEAEAMSKCREAEVTLHLTRMPVKQNVKGEAELLRK